MAEMDGTQYTLGRILAKLESIDEKLASMRENHDEVEERVSKIEGYYNKAIGILSFLTFIIGASGTYFWNRITGQQ